MLAIGFRGFDFCARALQPDAVACVWCCEGTGKTEVWVFDRIVRKGLGVTMVMREVHADADADGCGGVINVMGNVVL